MKRTCTWSLGLIALGVVFAQPAAANDAARKDIVTTAVKAGKFHTLTAALKAAGLVETLQGKGPFTVFAPSDEAFAKLPKATLESLLKPENKAVLARILKYHVVKGRKDSAAVLTSRGLTTLAGPGVHVNRTRDGVAINTSRLVKTDIDAANGIIHVIDAVLMPPEDRTASDEVRRLIEATVARGATMYNHGDERGCARLYQKAAERMMKMSTEVMPTDARTRLSKAMTEASRHHDADQQAWALRQGLDEVHELMSKKAGGRMTTQAGR